MRDRATDQTGRRFQRRTLLKFATAGGVMALLQACGAGATPTATSGGATTSSARPSTSSAAPAPSAAASAPAAAASVAASAAASAPSSAASSAAASAPGGATPAASGGVATAPQGNAPGGYPIYYPADYTTMVEAAKKEGKLQVYSIMSATNWKPVVEGFKKRYGIEVETVDAGATEVFTRYYAEAGGGARSADLIITSAPDAWQDFIKRGELATYTSPEDSYLPAWAKLAPSVYAVSSDPMVFIYNKKLVTGTVPKTMKELVDDIAKRPDLYKGKVTTYDAAANATGFANVFFWQKARGDEGWKQLEALGKNGHKFETSAGNMVNAVTAGEAVFGYFVSAISVFPKFPASESILGYSMIGDGTPILVRGMGITRKAASPNAAKLMVDYILSREGQIAWADGGLTAYRPDASDKAQYHIDKLSEGLGASALVKYSFDPDMADKAKTDAVLARWKQVMGR